MGRKRAKPARSGLPRSPSWPVSARSRLRASSGIREAVSAGKRVRVESAAQELGYVPNLAARALASQRTEVIGVLIPSLTNNVFSDVLRGIYDALDGSRYSIQLANTRYSILQEETLLRLFLAQKPAGLIVTGIDQTPEFARDPGSGRLPDRADHGDRPDAGRHDDRLFAFRCVESGDFPPARAGIPADRLPRRAHGSAGAAAARRLSGRDERSRACSIRGLS